MKDIEITLSNLQKSSSVQLRIKNTSENCYILSENRLMLDGNVRQENFIVTDSITHDVLIYQGITVKAIPSYIQLEPNQELKSEAIHLNLIYNLEHARSYDIYYKAVLTCTPCDALNEFDMAIVESNHIDLIAYD